jgi:hypothetical protein
MKTSSLKVLGCAAVFAVLTITRAQTFDDGQAVPPPDTSVQQGGAQQTDNAVNVQAVPQPQTDVTPNVMIVPVPTEMMEAGTNFNVTPGANPAQPASGSAVQRMQVLPPQGRTGSGNQFQGRNNNNNNDRGGRNRFGRDSGQQRNAVGDPGTFVPPTGVSTNGTDELYLNFRGAPIEEVLNYLSDAAGFIIQLDTRVSGTVDIWSAHPVNRNEAVQLLNSVLNKNGYAAIRTGRTLRIMSHEDAIHSQIPVIISNDPDTIPNTDEIVTQIIPIRYVQARQLITDLSPLTSSRATIIANDAGNSIIVTDTQANIRHLVELVKAIDGSAEDVTEVKVFRLQYHDPVEVATLLSQVFADQGGQGGTGGQTSPIRFGGGFGGGGFPGFGGGGFGGGGGLRQLFGGGGQGGGRQGGQGGGQNDRIRQRAKVVAVADQRTASVLVTAPKDLMSQIEELVQQVDQESPKVSHVTVVKLENADPQQMMRVLQQFQGANQRNVQGGNQNSALMQRQTQGTTSGGTTGFGTGGGGFGGGGNGGGFGGGGFGGGGGGGGFGGGGGGFGR